MHDLPTQRSDVETITVDGLDVRDAERGRRCVVIAGRGVSDSRHRVAVAIKAALEIDGLTPFPWDWSAFDEARGPFVIAWFRQHVRPTAIVWIGVPPPWAAVERNDVVVASIADAAEVTAAAHHYAWAPRDEIAPRPWGTIPYPLVVDPPRSSGPVDPIDTLILAAVGATVPTCDGSTAVVASTPPADGPLGATFLDPPHPVLMSLLERSRRVVIVTADSRCEEVAGWLVDATAAGHRPIVLSSSDVPRWVSFPTTQIRSTHPADWPTRTRVTDHIDRDAVSDHDPRHWLRSAVGWGPDLITTSSHPVASIRPRAARVSVVVPTYNSAPVVAATIESVLDQTFRDFELILIDDGSKDTTPDVIERYLGNEHVRLVRQENIGRGSGDRFEIANNRTWTLGAGEFIARLDGDDLAAPTRLEEQVKLLDRCPEVGLVHTSAVTIDQFGRPTGSLFDLSVTYTQRTLLRLLLTHNFVAHPTVMTRRRLLERTDAYDGGWASDYDLWLRLARHSQFRHIEDRLVAYRISAGGISTTGDGVAAGIRAGVETRRRARHRIDISELFSELFTGPADGPSDTLARAACHLEFGSMLIRHGGPENYPLALEEFAASFELGGGTPAAMSALTAAVNCNDTTAIDSWARALEATRPGSINAIRSGDHPLTLHSGDELVGDLADRLRDMGEGDIDAHGHVQRTVTMLARFEPGDYARLAPVVEEYLERFTATDPVRLVLDLGRDVNDAMALVSDALSALRGIETGARLDLSASDDDQIDSIDPAMVLDGRTIAGEVFARARQRILFDGPIRY